MASPVKPTIPQPSVLDTVDLSLNLTRKEYAAELDSYQAKLQDLSWQAYRAKRSVVGVFEGWDAAGKGSAIRRVTGAMDPRLYRLLQFAAPTDEERAHHYLWRFWRQLQRDGRATLYDRSWYGRVLVERVEKLATTGQWQRAYHEINQFEEQLVKHGCIVVKFWLHISPDEQLARFKAREEVPHKNYKITEDDWRNRERWHDYEKAVDDMVCHTSTRHAPWTLVSGNHKHYARIQILRTLCEAMESALAAPT
jgi:polyphosphate kinase 2 (PPK2 family)